MIAPGYASDLGRAAATRQRDELQWSAEMAEEANGDDYDRAEFVEIAVAAYRAQLELLIGQF